MQNSPGGSGISSSGEFLIGDGKENTMQQITTSVQLVLAQHCNGTKNGRLFGGQLMAWIDVVGAVAARRYAHAEVTTACIDHLDFIAAAHLNDMVVQEARVTWTGRTSMEVRVDSFVEHRDGTRTLVNRAFGVYVALDDEEKPAQVPLFVPETEEEKAEYTAALERRKIRLGR